MKFIKKFLLIIVGVLVLLSPAVASAAPGVSISTSADPQTVYRKDLAEPDESTITVRLDGSGTAGTEHAPTDVVLVIDVSGSMAGQPLIDEQAAAISFINHMDASYDKIGLVSFESAAYLDQPLTTNFTDVETAVNALTAGGGTNYEDAILIATAELNGSNHRSDASKVMIFMSDGDPGSCNTCDPDDLESLISVTEATVGLAKDSGITVYTIGSLENLEFWHLGYTDEARALLQEMASSTLNTNDHYFEAPTSGDLTAIYDQIATLLIQTAGQDTAIELKFDPNLELVPNSWSITPTSSNGGLYSFDVGTLNLNDSWTVTFRVTFPHASLHDIFDVTGSRYTYTNYLGESSDNAVPQVQVNVLDRTPDAGDWTIIFIGIVAMLLTFQIYRFTKILKAQHN